MPDGAAIAGFVTTAVLLVAVPGPNMIYIFTRTVAHGRAAGLTSVLGVGTGTLVHVTAAILGLSAVVGASPTALTVIRYAGAGYLVHLAVRAIRARSGAADDRASPASLGRIYADGLTVNLLNPKALLFFLAFLPQFIDDTSDAHRQLVGYGIVFLAIAVLLDICYVAIADGFRRMLARRGPEKDAARWARFVVAGIYLGIAGYAVIPA